MAQRPSQLDQTSGQRAGGTASFAEQLKASFQSSLGSIIFGMEDGTVSIFGLVFGVGASASSSATVLLAGATGAIAAAVSMMAGTYLEVESSRDQANAQLAQEREEMRSDPQAEMQEMRDRLAKAGFTEQEIGPVVAALQRHPDSWLRVDAGSEMAMGDDAQQQPLVQALWMFVSDLIAAFTPVIPFALFGLATARLVSIGLTTLMLTILGIGRGLIGKRNVVWTTLETLAIAAAAAGAGLLIGKLIPGG
jgi:VIT1/CCC1 family predicted Fe2+/Mn2+ transporter